MPDTYSPTNLEWVKWQAKDINKVADEILDFKIKAYKTIKTIGAKDRNFKNTIAAIEDSSSDITAPLHFIHILLNASPNKNIRDAAQKAIQKIERKLIDIEYDEKIYKAVKEYEQKKEKLVGEDLKLFQDFLRDYKRMGFELPLKQRQKLKNNLKTISRLSSLFEKNIHEYKDSIKVSREELKGLPENYINGLKKSAKNKYIVTLQYPDLIPFLENAENESKRKELAEKNLHLGGDRNLKLIKQIIKLRDKNAKILKYKNHADFTTEIKMAKTGKNVLLFINGLINKLKKGYKKDYNLLLNQKVKLKKKTYSRIEFYETSYLSNQLRKNLLNVDNEKIREYFPLETVKNGTFRIYSKLFTINFKKLNGYNLWHKDVEFYQITDKNKSIIGYFTLDLYPREGKFNHMAVFPIIPSRKIDGKRTPTFCAMLGNFPKPNKKYPSLLSHEEVSTFFHEFGHIMHENLSQTKYRYHAGTTVARDFVEAPSQMLEYWTKDKAMLKILSGHWKNPKQKLPEQLLKNLIKSKELLICSWTLRQLVFALYDLNLHLNQNIEKINSSFLNLVKKYQKIQLPKNTIFAAGFGHLVGYDAGYYGYLWSRVFAADMFTRFQKEGLLNSKTGNDYKQWILEKGSGVEPTDLLKGFLKRKPNNKAFLKEIGL